LERRSSEPYGQPGRRIRLTRGGCATWPAGAGPARVGVTL